MEAVILTMSDKDNGYCVVAYDIQKNKLVRFVSSSEGAAIPKHILLNNNINLLDIVYVQEITARAIGPQTENILIDLSTVTKIGVYTYGIEEIIRQLPSLPDDEPMFMSMRSYNIDDASIYHHSIEIIRVSNMCSHVDRYGRIKCKFDTNIGTHSFLFITVPEYHHATDSWSVGDAYVIMTIPSAPYIKDGIETGYYKFVAAVYKI